MLWLDDVMVTSSLLSDVRQASSLLLSSHNRVSIFCWTKERKLGFLTSFSYFSCYFFILSFLLSCYFLVSLRLSSLHKNQNSLSCFLIPWALWGSALYMHPQVSLFLLEWDFCATLVVDSVPGCFPILTLCQRFLVQMSIGRSQIILFLWTRLY